MTSVLLRNLFNGTEPSKLLIVNGQLPSASPLPLWLALLASRKQIQPCSMIVSNSYVLPASSIQNCSCLHANSADEQLSHINHLCTTTDMTDPCFVFIDNVDLLFYHYSASLVISEIKRLSGSSHILGVVILFNSDSQSDEIKSALYYYATSTITVNKSFSIGSSVGLSLCLLHKKKSGKVSCELLSVEIDIGFGYISSAPKESTTTPSEPPINDPTVGLTTFNLTLSEGERSARSQLKLPYTKSEDSKANELSGGRIVYEPDEYDDMDEEDPDDDLDV